MPKKQEGMHINMRKVKRSLERQQVLASGGSSMIEVSKMRKIIEENKDLREKVESLEKGRKKKVKK